MSIHHLIHSHFILILIVMTIILVFIIVKKINKKKIPKKITKEKYELTLQGKMIEILNAEKPMFNIWPFVSELKSAHVLPKKINEDTIVHKVYRTSNEKFEHILLSTDKEHQFVIIIVNRIKNKIKGYYTVTLPNNKYPQ